MTKITTIKEAQERVKFFAQINGWTDSPNIDKFDHLHEELIEMSKHLRYKSEDEKIKFISENKEIFIDGLGDLFFGLCRLANQLGFDLTEVFDFSQREIFAKYNGRKVESKIFSRVNPTINEQKI